MKKVAVIGASIGGLVAATELQARGFQVTIYEKGKTVGGLYGKVATPFGPQELGMHVLYLTAEHYRHLCDIFGKDVFHTWQGSSVDLGACHNFGKNFYNSIYPDVRELPTAEIIRKQILENKQSVNNPANALEAVIYRFGEEAGVNVFAPILKKLWKLDASQLSKDAIHCFYDLRRIIVCDKAEADILKKDAWLDNVIGNPLQSQPCGKVFGGRIAARFKNSCGDLSEKVHAWLKQKNINIEFGQSVEIVDKQLMLNGAPLHEQYNGCIVATPLSSLLPAISKSLDQLDLSIYYFKLAKNVTDLFPSYYILCHDSDLVSSRIVNFSAYNVEDNTPPAEVLAVEIAHAIGDQPTEQTISNELKQVLPFAVINDVYKHPNSLRIPIPSLKNANLLDNHCDGMVENFPNHALFFSGMRTDKGVFFSHHTIGHAYDSAVECAEKLS